MPSSCNGLHIICLQNEEMSYNAHKTEPSTALETGDVLHAFETEVGEFVHAPAAVPDVVQLSVCIVRYKFF